MDTKAKFPIFHLAFFFMMDFLAVIISITLLFLFASYSNVPRFSPYVPEIFETLRTGFDFGVVAAAFSFLFLSSIMISEGLGRRRKKLTPRAASQFNSRLILKSQISNPCRSRSDRDYHKCACQLGNPNETLQTETIENLLCIV